MKRLAIIMLAALLFAGCDKKKDEPKVYTVTFDSDGGTAVPKQTVEAGGVATAPENPVKKDYVFLYWHLSGASTAYNFQTPVNSNITLVAKWEEEARVEYWQVTWVLNGGAWPAGYAPPTQAVKGGTLAEPAEPEKPDSEFAGWYKEAEMTNKVNFPYDVSAVTADFTLYAKWEVTAVEAHLDVLFKDDDSFSPVVSPLPFFDNGTGGWWDDFFFLVRTNQSSWEAISDQEWCTLERNDASTKDFPEGEEGFLIYFEPNTNDSGREVTITVTAGNADPVTFSITQMGKVDQYFGTWRVVLDDGFWEQVTISADKVVWVDNDGYGYTLTELTWSETNNPGGDHTVDYPMGYRVAGKLTANNGYNIPKATGSGYAAVGDIALDVYYISADLQSIRVGNAETAEHEALYGPYYWKQNVEYWQVSWNLNGGSWPTYSNHVTKVPKDGRLRIPNTPVKEGNTFAGWYKEASLTNQVNFPYDVSSVTGNFTLYAKWSDVTTISITKQAPFGCTYGSINIYRFDGEKLLVDGGYGVPTTAGTSNINVTPGTYCVLLQGSVIGSGALIYTMTPSFTISAGQTIRVSVSCSHVGLVNE